MPSVGWVCVVGVAVFGDDDGASIGYGRVSWPASRSPSSHLCLIDFTLLEIQLETGVDGDGYKVAVVDSLRTGIRFTARKKKKRERGGTWWLVAGRSPIT